MASNSGRINRIFGGVVILLAAVAAVSMYRNLDLPVIQEAAAPELPANAQLPGNHPPLDSANRLAALEQMSRESPQNPEFKTQIGNLYYDMGQYEKAISAYEDSLKLQPGNPHVETDLATCYHYIGQDDKSLAILDRVLQYRPNFPQALFNKGIVLQEGNKDPKGAIEVWEGLLTVNPDFPQRAELERRIKQLKSAAN